MFTSDLNVIPQDIYARFAQWFHAADMLDMKRLNGGAYVEHFPPYLTSLDSMISQHLRLGGKAVYGQFPRHNFMLKGTTPYVLPMIRDAYHTLDSQALHEFFSDFATQATALSEFSDYKSETSATIRDMIAQEFGTLVRLGASMQHVTWLNPNINQAHRAAQQAFVDDGLTERLEYASQLLTRYCMQHELKWSIRPPIAFHSYASATLYERSDMAGLHDPTWNLSPAMQYAMTATPQAIQQYLYPPHLQPYNDYLSQFRFWEHRAAYGLIWAPATGDTQGLNSYELAIIPRSTPSAIYSRFDHGAPLYSRVVPGLSPMDSHARVVYGTLDGEYQDTYALDGSLSDSHATALAVLNYICLGYSIFVATIPMGKGNHKPAWTNSPLNTPLIRALHAIQRPLLERLRSKL